MIDQESGAFGDKEPFDFNLSAFLSAAKTVDNRRRQRTQRGAKSGMRSLQMVAWPL